MRPGPLRSFLIIFALVCTLVMNALANILPLNGVDTGTLSDRYPILTVPAGYAFSIWGLIYLGLLGFAVYQALPAQRDNPRIGRIAVPFLVSCIANILWIVTWHWQILPVNIVMMLVLLASLITIYRRLREDTATPSLGERLLVRVPFSIYMGWITVATIVNATVVLYAAGWQDTGSIGAMLAAVLFVVAAAIATAIALRFRDPAYALVVVWALVAVSQKHAGVPLVATSAIVLAGVIALVAGYALVQLLRGGQSGGQQLRTA